MRQHVLRWLHRCQFPLMLLLSAAPLALMLLCVHAPDMLPACGAFFAAFVLLSSLCLAVPGRQRLPAACVSAALLVLLGIIALPFRDRPALLLLPTALVALLFFSLPIAARRYESEIPPFVYVAGIGIHVIAQFLHHHFSLSSVSPYEPVAPALTIICLAYMLLLLLSMNRISLDNASLARHRVPQSIRRFNTVLTLGFMAFSLILALTPAVVRGISSLWQGLLAVIARINEFLLSLLPAAADYGSAAGGTPQFGLPEAAAEPSALAQMLEKVFSVVTAILVFVGLLFLLRLIVIWLAKLLRRLFARLRRYIFAASTEYDDEITDTRGDGAERSVGVLRRAKSRARAQDKTPVGRIRQIYARLRHRHPKWADSSTARENLPADAAALYERARYSDHPVTGEEAERFAAGTKKL